MLLYILYFFNIKETYLKKTDPKYAEQTCIDDDCLCI